MITIGQRAPDAGDLVGHLLACHERIRRFVALAAKAGEAAAAPAEIGEACAAVERYFERALPLHVEDEERSIVPRLIGRRDDVDEALRTMETQHRAHDALIAELLVASRSLRASPADRTARERLRGAAVRLAADLEPHLELEERIVFPALRTLLRPEQLAEIRQEQRARRGGA
jgi:iron-sulfur cluster repair protein YtfE (RIC family)